MAWRVLLFLFCIIQSFVITSQTYASSDSSSDGSTTYQETSYKETEQKVLEEFYSIVALTSSNTTMEKGEQITKFKDILKCVVKNKVGRFVLISIINKLKSLGFSKSSNYILKVLVDNKSPQFKPQLPPSPAKIMFTTVPMPLYVVPSQIATQNDIRTPPDVALFHELLHWARYLIVDDFLKLIKKEEASTGSFDHPIFSDHPDSARWLTAAQSKKIVATPVTGEQDSDIETFLPQLIKSSFPQLGVWLTSAGTLKRGNSHYPAINIEEVRNIVGGECCPVSKKTMSDVFLYDICENGYRLVEALPLRYGHKNFSCPVDPDLIEWCLVRAQKCLDVVSEYIGG